MRSALFLVFAWLMVVGSCQSPQVPQGSQGNQKGQGEGEGKQLIMLEIERLNYPDEDKVVKRQAEVRYGGTPGQYVVQTSDQGGAPQQVPPEYLSLLQHLSPQPSQPHDIQQLFISRGSQGSFAQFQTPQRTVANLPRLSPQQEEMRRLQEHEANKHIREQQERALQRALQTGQFQPGFQPGFPPQPPQPQQYQPQYQQQVQQPQQQVQTPQLFQQSQQYQQPQQQVQQPQLFQQSQQYQQPQQYQPQQADPQDYPQYETPPSAYSESQYSQSSSGPQYYQTRSIRPSQIPEKFSYSEVKFGTSDIAREKLEPRLVSIEQRLQNQVKPQPQYYVQVQPESQPQPQPQPQPQLQKEPQRPVDYSTFNVQQPQQQTPTQPQHPQQYLIETTKPAQNEENIVRIPRPRPASQPQSLFYRPDAPIAERIYAKVPEAYTTIPQPRYQPKSPEPYTTIPLEVYNQVPAQYTSGPEYRPEPQGPPLPSPDAPSRSAIYVHQTTIGKRITTQPPPNYSSFYSQGVPRIPTPHGQRTLTASEIKALSKAGFQISPLALNSLQESSEISPNDEEGEEYKAVNSKRQSFYVDERKPPGKYPKRIPKPVPLTETERKLLAEQGIRNLYRVESSESKDAPVTYVLAIDNSMVRKRESEESQENKN